MSQPQTTLRVEAAPAGRVAVENAASLSAIVRDLANDAGALVRGEIALARNEVEQKTTRLISGLITLFGAMLLAYAGLVIVLLAGVQALSFVIPLWAALLAVGAVILAIGVALALAARKALNPPDMVPQRTAANLSRDVRVVKENVA